MIQGVPRGQMTAQGDINRQLASFRKALRENSDPARAEYEKRYLKSPHNFFGVTVPFINKMAKEFRKANGAAPADFVFEVARRLWASEYHQEKTLAVKILEEYPERLDMDAMPLLERMLSECAGWDHADGISAHLVGEVLGKDRRAFAYLNKWSVSRVLWLRRASLISQIILFRRGGGDRELFFRLAEKMLDEKEFFIRKAIGWAVRDISKAHPDEAYAFLMKIKGRASGLTLREGSKRLPARMKASVLDT